MAKSKQKDLLGQMAEEQSLSTPLAPEHANAEAEARMKQLGKKRTRRRKAEDKAAEKLEAECDELTAFRWVASHLGDEVLPTFPEAPSRAAWNLFCAAKADDDLAADLWKRFLALGAKQDDNTGDRLGQTGRFVNSLLDELIDATREEAYSE